MGTLAKNAILHGGNGDERIHPWILGMPDVWANTFHVLGDPDPHARIVKAVIVGGKCQKCALIAGNIGLGHHPKQLYIPYLSLHLPRNLRMACKMWGWLNLSSHHSWKKTSVLKRRSLNQATIYIIIYICVCICICIYIYRYKNEIRKDAPWNNRMWHDSIPNYESPSKQEPEWKAPIPKGYQVRFPGSIAACFSYCLGTRPTF